MIPRFSNIDFSSITNESSGKPRRTFYASLGQSYFIATILIKLIDRGKNVIFIHPDGTSPSHYAADSDAGGLEILDVEQQTTGTI